MIQQTGLADEINRKLKLLKRHIPYYESDHILNIAYNIISGGTCLEDIELRRNDEAHLNALGAQIIPDPTTAGDYLRRFDQEDVVRLMDIVNDIRKLIWLQQSSSFRKEAVINVDGTISPTTGECKEGMDISYNGQWGYHPLVISLSGTREPLFIVNRSGNVPSHTDSAKWIDKSLDLVSDVFEKVSVRRDTVLASQTILIDGPNGPFLFSVWMPGIIWSRLPKASPSHNGNSLKEMPNTRLKPKNASGR